MVSHWSLSDSKSPQVSRILFSSLPDINNSVVWMISTRPFISQSSSPCINPLVTVSRAPITNSITITFIYNGYLHHFHLKLILLLLSLLLLLLARWQFQGTYCFNFYFQVFVLIILLYSLTDMLSVGTNILVNTSLNKSQTWHIDGATNKKSI